MEGCYPPIVMLEGEPDAGFVLLFTPMNAAALDAPVETAWAAVCAYMRSDAALDKTDRMGCMPYPMLGILGALANTGYAQRYGFAVSRYGDTDGCPLIDVTDRTDPWEEREEERHAWLAALQDEASIERITGCRRADASALQSLLEGDRVHYPKPGTEEAAAWAQAIRMHDAGVADEDILQIFDC